jgi:hypothetical protein
LAVAQLYFEVAPRVSSVRRAEMETRAKLALDRACKLGDWTACRKLNNGSTPPRELRQRSAPNGCDPNDPLCGL